MDSLKSLREKHNLSQTAIGTYIKLPASQISLFENGQTLPDLEDCLILEKQLGERIQWNEKLTPARKFEVVQGIIDLSQKYPVEMVLEFCSRMYRRESYPDTMIVNYARLSGADEPEALLPAGIANKAI